MTQRTQAVVSRELLEELAAMLPEEPKTAAGQAHTNGRGSGGSFDLEAWIVEHRLEVIGPRPWGGGRRWIFRVCPWNPDHTNGSAFILQGASGAIGARCHHNGCRDKDWHALRDVVEPGWRDARKGADRWDSSKNNCPATEGASSKASGQVGQMDASTCFLSAPPFFPLEAFPQKYQGVIEENARAFVVPVEVPAMALLTLAGACIGRSRAIQIKRGWLEHSNLYVGVVARSGLGKSPATRHIFKQVFALEKKWHAEYQKKALEFTTDSNHKKKKKDGDPARELPKWRQLIVDDATPEALTDALYFNPRGILWNRDELSGLILDLDKYAGKEGSTKTRLMSAYDSGLWKLNRVNPARCGFIPHATLSLFGTIQPEAMAMIFSKRDFATGFLPRFFFVRAEREAPAFWTDETVSEETDKALEELVEKLLEHELLEDMPQIIKPSPSARMRYVDWFNQQSMEAWAGIDATLYDAVLAKLRGQCLRICLILHCMEAVARGTTELAPIAEGTMLNAILLANCLKEHQKQAWQFVNSQAEELTPIQRRVARAIIDLEGEIQGGMLPTARITDQLNRRMEEKFHIKTEAVGKATASLGLVSKHLPDKSARGIVLNPEDLERLRNILTPTVPTVPTVPNVGSTLVCGQDSNRPELSELSGRKNPGGRFGQLADGCKIPQDADEISLSDGSDGSDGCSEEKKETVGWLEI